MTEEINNINTDLKELFVNQKYEEMLETLDGLSDDVALEIALFNHDVIDKYYREEKFDLIRQYLTFTAYTSFVFEYAVKRELLPKDVAEEKYKLYTNIFEMLQG